MMRRRIFSYIICFFLIFVSGCWDRKELNDRAIWLATGWDVGEKENIRLSGQIVVPSKMQSQNGGGGGAKEYFTVSATGKNVNDALQNMQTKLSRESFPGHRRVVFFGEEFAKHGLKHQLDANTRGPDVSLRTDIFIVKGGTAIEALNLSYPLEKPPAAATIKVHEEIGGRGDTAFLSFLIAATSDGVRPTVPVVQIGQSQVGDSSGKENASESVLQIAGVAIFNKDLELIGYLNNLENRAMLWVMGILKKLTITVPIKNGNASLIMTKIKSDIVPEISKDNKIKFIVKLTGEGALLENNTDLNLIEPKNIKYMEKKFEERAQKKVQQVIKKVQEEYGTDIFGFGEAIHKKHPHLWKSLKKDWDMHFSDAIVSVKVNLRVKRIGMTGQSILSESESNDEN
ncbi:Ger(x)C family spore germination protein [Bacillus sp. DTU_2020_1000418_1_SI_GHA_SEK_038]|uniref:Ger(x)C family spore germination protein n=1 Tax=Bacillus sp. DTU_2020_1000418_1_SI_GHA_SEK_038 TaxID=3077585 RepID=UPI0028E3DDF9|nr:Ger(x)C family spore germination protein [Bacillus sp. DTU_2020_1000418_1_SI_GHA_SEK_038]WNS77459.1 Ger(x)C family spore germination protein [Bacillus sp. DTU_2020_1000418_1_SI_GHA_SEK_038]